MNRLALVALPLLAGLVAGPSAAYDVTSIPVSTPISVDGLLATDQYVYAAGSFAGNSAFRVDLGSGVVETVLTGLSGPVDLALDDQSRLYSTNWGSNTISRGMEGDSASVWVSIGVRPGGLLFDPDGTLWCTLGDRVKIKKVAPDGTVTVVASGGILQYPLGITLADDGNFYIAGLYSGEIYRMTPAGAITLLTTVPGTGQFRIGHLEFAQGKLYATGLSNHVVYEVTLAGDVSVIAGQVGVAGTDDGPLGVNTLTNPNGIAVSSSGDRLYVANGLGAISAVRVIHLPDATGAPSLPLAADSGMRIGSIAPNPSRGATRIEFEVPRSGVVDLSVMDVRGRRVRTLARGPRSPGRHVVSWNGEGTPGEPVAAGIYFLKLSAEGASTTRTITRLR
ncbi:MAG: hypothetical protein DHS20C21_06330 [Gemmatimonadota bacterium]|nr:MAG: hypothetical protein DHS20C21_06330 [Gemmatimonadota bacterium]